MTLHPHAIRQLEVLLEERAGHVLGNGRLSRMETLLQPLAADHGSIELMLARALLPEHPGLGDRVVEALLNHESFFFRDPEAFAGMMDVLGSRLRAARASRRRLRIWSAGCSTGQEVYSLAIATADDPDRWRGWTIDLLGTDLSAAALAQADAGRYNRFEIQRGLSADQVRRWFEEDGKGWRACPQLRAGARFARHNLRDPSPDGPFDLILCRNVMLYLLPAVRDRVLERLHRALAPDGLLMLGAGETVIGRNACFEPDPVARGLYRPVPR